jgi:hypothetical protein
VAGQSKLGSLIESLANIVIGLCVAVAAQMVVFPFYGLETTVSDNFSIAGWFTLVSLARSYLLRRYFNNRLRSASESVARNVYRGS